MLEYVGCELYLLNVVMLIFRFLASGNSQISMSFSYRVAPSTAHYTIMSTCETIWNKVSPKKLQPTSRTRMEDTSGRILFTVAVP
jgi:hypothetical protein